MEPPTDSIRHCQPAQNPFSPPSDFPWESLQGVAVNIFWVPIDQKYAWIQSIEEHGLGDTFALFTSAESAVVPVLPPHPAMLSDEIQETQREETRQTVRNFGLKFIRIVGLVVGLMLLGLV